MPRLKQQLGNGRPLTNFSLVGHSFGGMIVNLILRKGGNRLDGMNRAITVATPFYGYGGQIHRWFEGVSLLNHLGENKIDIIKTLGSLPASYTLNWLGEDAFNSIREQLGRDLFKIDSYPSRDRADPYNPPDPDQNGRVRYPARLGFSREELKNGLKVCTDLVGPLPDELAKSFSILGVFKNSARHLTRPLAAQAGISLIPISIPGTTNRRLQMTLGRATKFLQRGRLTWLHCQPTTAKL